MQSKVSFNFTRIAMRFSFWFSLLLLASTGSANQSLEAQSTLSSDPQGERLDDGTVHVPAFILPESPLLSAKTRARLGKTREETREASLAEQPCPPGPTEKSNPRDMPAVRKCWAEYYLQNVTPKLLKQFEVRMRTEYLAGIYVEIFEPIGGVASRNRKRVLVNVHGGGFIGGARMSSHIESIPVAAAGKIRVISIDYRLGPEHSFPAASQDIASVYRELLKTYKPNSIGIYGCSAGGLLTAEAIVWFETEHLPVPGAAGMLCNGAEFWAEGDSATMVAAITGSPIPPLSVNPYFRGVDPLDPLAFPIHSPEMMAKFPPCLLLSGTRDFALSSAIHTHSVLVSKNVDAELHMWEGMQHAFLYDPDLPESSEAYSIIAAFFEKYLKR